MGLVTPSSAIPFICTALMTLASVASAQEVPIVEAVSGQTVAAPTPNKDMVRVYVTSDRKGAVFGRTAAFGPGTRKLRWPRRPEDEPNYSGGVCTAPCSATVAISRGPYSVVGHDVAPAERFALHLAPSGLDVDVHAGSWGGYVVGLAFSTIGLVFAGLGGAELGVWGATGAPPMSSQSVGSFFLLQGSIFLGVGLPLAAIGLPLWLSNRTQVDISEHRTAGSKGVELLPNGFAF